MTRYGKLTAWLIAAWFAFSLGASALHLYRTGPNQPPLALGAAFLTPVVVFLAWFRLSPRFREFTHSLDTRVLTLIQSWRFGGLVFLVLASFGILPWLFALPAGLGDMAIGVTAAYAALKLASHRRGFLRWQVLGILDLVNAVLLGTLTGFIEPHGISTSAMTVLPMSLIPTFGVPLFLIFHIICMAQARRWPAPQERPVHQPCTEAA